tara:strand:- start:1649 stop:1933 length:285 start_codon:yes stop_codon:yes gene_type:complete
MVVKYLLQEENSVGVEKTKEGGVYLPFSFSLSAEQLADKITLSMKDIINKNKNEVLSMYFTAYFEGDKVLDGHFYLEQNIGEGRWITPGSETMH